MYVCIACMYLYLTRIYVYMDACMHPWYVSSMYVCIYACIYVRLRIIQKAAYQNHVFKSACQPCVSRVSAIYMYMYAPTYCSIHM